MNMKGLFTEFIRKGLSAMGLGPIVLGVVYLVLNGCAGVYSLPTIEVCKGIFSLSLLAFVAGGINVLYKIERLALMLSVLIHGGVLYFGYLATYLFNKWIAPSSFEIIVFSAIFVILYAIIWAIIYGQIKRNTCKVNKALKSKQEGES